jgi:hypothetical protein
MIYYPYMKNINKKLNIRLFGLKILSLLVLAILVLPNVSSAATYGRDCNEVGCNYNYMSAPGMAVPVSPVVTTVPTVYSSTNVVSKATPVKKSTGTVLGASTAKPTVSEVASNVVYGSNGFLPSGIIGWILFAILVLIIVILARKAFGGEKNYHSTPLKHA